MKDMLDHLNRAVHFHRARRIAPLDDFGEFTDQRKQYSLSPFLVFSPRSRSTSPSTSDQVRDVISFRRIPVAWANVAKSFRSAGKWAEHCETLVR